VNCTHTQGADLHMAS